jgi:hypothetical protein
MRRPAVEELGGYMAIAGRYDGEEHSHREHITFVFHYNVP